MGATVATPTFRLDRGALPKWAAWAIAAAGLLIALALIAGTGVAPGVALVFGALVSIAGIYIVSRAVENSRRATDRAITFGVSYAFLLVCVPLVSVLYTVISKGLARFDTSSSPSRSATSSGPAAAPTTRSSAR